MDITNLNYDDDDVLLNNGVNSDDDSGNDGDDSGNQQQNQEEPDVLESFLKNQGISDIHKIKFEDEDGLEIERDWDELSHDERLNILSSGNSNPAEDLDDEEIDLINKIRASRLSPQEYLDSLIPNVRPIIEEPTYTIDSLTDDELYMLDLQTRIEDITDEQLQTALTKAKEDEDLFNKQIAGLRNEYKKLEDERNLQQQAEREEAANQQYQQFSNNINNAIVQFDSIGDLDVSMNDDDMNELSSFILDRDETGTSYFARALNNPAELVRMAWFALHGEDMLNQISDYYKKLISQVSKTNYQKGYDAAINGEKPKVAVRSNKTKQPIIKSVDNLLY